MSGIFGFICYIYVYFHDFSARQEGRSRGAKVLELTSILDRLKDDGKMLPRLSQVGRQMNQPMRFFFPTSLCGVLVFDSVSPPPASRRLLFTHIFHTPSFNHRLSHTIFYTPSFVFHLAWHLATYTFVLRGRRGTYGIGLALVSHALSLSHTIFVTQHLSHTIFHTPSFTPNFVTHHLWHTFFRTPHCHPPSLTHHL